MAMLKSLKSFKAFKAFHSWKRFEHFERAEPNATRRSPACWTGRDRTVLTRGFTLLETIVAFAVILAALIGPVSLITRGLIDVTFAKNKLIALNLAQEGIEFVRLARDNNILCDYINGGTDVSWDQNPQSGSRLDPPSAGATDFEVDMNNLDNMASPQNCPLMDSPHFDGYSGAVLKQDTGGFYQYGGIGVDTPFKREISIETLTGPDRMRIISEVTWTERGLARTVTLKDVLYNWR